MAVTSLKVLQQLSGNELLSSSVPVAPSVASVAGQNKINISWYRTATDGTPTQFVTIRYTASDLTSLGSPGSFVEINWGDGNLEKYPGGWNIDFEAEHEYTSDGPVTISASLNFSYIDITLDEMASITISTGGDYFVDQIQIEKYQDGVKIYEPDWLPISRLDTSYVDDRVNKKHSYRYRYRLRTTDDLGQPLVTSQFSNISEQSAWS